MATVTYQQLKTENLFMIDYSPIVQNFKTIDSFIKNFATFQRKLAEIEKAQKATAHDLSNFKMSTTNTFSTMNEVLDSRGNISKGNNKVFEDGLEEVKKTLKELKMFVTDSTRGINTAFEEKERQAQEVYKKFQAKFQELTTQQNSQKIRVESLQEQIYTIKAKYALRTQTDSIKSNLLTAKDDIVSMRTELEETKEFLKSIGVKQFKDILDKMSTQLYGDMQSLKAKFKLKTDVSDTLKLQEMMLNTINFAYQNVAKKYSNKNQTKKALIFLERKINSLVQILTTEDTDKDGLVATKGWKCISCTKDLGEYQGKLENYKAWALFPAKDSNNKDKYNGFGTGFQSIIETAVSKKGGEIGYDEKGRMTTPFNLAREAKGTLKKSESQNKISSSSKSSPLKGLSESNYMNLFGRNSEVDIDIWAEYLQKEKGLKSTLKRQA